jgi:(p)ppGpp synthase/HD superfamily hydrolase
VHVALPPPRTARACAIQFAIDAYDGVAVRPGKGLPHAQAVADIVATAGADETVQIAALLHDIVEDTPTTVDEVREQVGEQVGDMVGALSEDPEIKRYAPRKRALRGQIAAARPAVMDIALADKIATLRHAAITRTPVSRRKLGHYRATLRLAMVAEASPVLTEELDRLLLGAGA